MHYNFEAIDRIMSYLSMKTTIPDGESRVMQLVADFYVKLEEANLPTLYESESRKCVRNLVNAIRLESVGGTGVRIRKQPEP